MEIIRITSPQMLPKLPPMVATLGQFDGFHEAHQVLVNQTIEIAQSTQLAAGLITFDPHPALVLNKNNDLKFLTPNVVKYHFLEPFGLDYLIVLEFNHDLATLESTQFIQTYLLGLNVKKVVVGFDYRYGAGRKGYATDINRDSGGLIDVTIINELTHNGEKIGSTLVRKLLAQGEVKEANRLLHRPYMISGQVEKGKQIGRTLALPTANILLNEEYVAVKDGVYVVKVKIPGSDQLYGGFCNIGHNPSFNYKDQKNMEVHLFDVILDLYGQVIEVYFVDYLRPELKFVSYQAFLEQIETDRNRAKQILAQNS